MHIHIIIIQLATPYKDIMVPSGIVFVTHILLLSTHSKNSNIKCPSTYNELPLNKIPSRA